MVNSPAEITSAIWTTYRSGTSEGVPPPKKAVENELPI